MNQYAVCVLCNEKLDLTRQTLESICSSNQPCNSYDLYLIDNGSSQATQSFFKCCTEKYNLKNIFLFQKPVNISKAWNLFLVLTKDYNFRTLIDNDIVLKNTFGLGEMPLISNMSVKPSQNDPGTSFTIGAGRKTRKKDTSDFLDKASSFMSAYKLGILSYVPVLKGPDFHDMILAFSQNKKNKIPYIVGGCTTISKSVIDKIGYFDERLYWYIYMDYSTRFVKTKGKIGFHDNYWVLHKHQNNKNQQHLDRKRESLKLIDEDDKNKILVNSSWEPIIDEVNKMAQQSPIINIS